MENSGIKKYFVVIIVMYFIWAVMYASIVASLAMMNMADVKMGIFNTICDDAVAIIGISLSSILGFGVGGLGIVLSTFGLTTGEKKPGMAKHFSIANVVFIAACLGTMIFMVIMSYKALASSANCALLDPLSEERTHCTADAGYSTMVLLSMLVISVACIIGITSTEKIVSILNKTVLHKRSVPGSTSSQQAVVAKHINSR